MMRRFALPFIVAVCVISPALGFAATELDLRPQPTSHGAIITLGDVFDGAQGAAADMVIAHAAQPGLDAVLDAATVQLTVRRAGFEWANSTGFHRIIVSSLAGEAPATVARATKAKAAARRGRAPQALIYARNLQTGEIVGAADLVWSSDAIALADGVSEPDAAIGKAARHALRAGSVAAFHDLSSPRVVKRDDVVAVVYEAEGVSLTLQGKAMADATVGDVLDVINPQSKKVIEAVCIGPGQAVVGPRADALKAANYQPGGQGRLLTASLH
jgi:flagella basal body P-ring formation protein FlgA